LESNSQFDYAIIGCGVAGLHLAYQFSIHPFFSSKRIAIIDKLITPKNDRIISYWEKGVGIWDEVVHKQWNETFFNAKYGDLKIDLAPFTYKSLNFNDFSAWCKKRMLHHSNIVFLESQVVSINELSNKVVIELNDSNVTANYVFDSRLSDNYHETKRQFDSVIQSFKGWEVVFELPVFDDEVFTMMDYRYQWKDSNSFMYVLPKSNKEALLEYTFFSSKTITSEEFDIQIRGYINTFFPNVNYTIKKVEAGEIPMTIYPFQEDSSDRIIKIGTAGGWVKASTGYSFKFSEKIAKKIVAQLEKGQTLNIGYKQHKRFKFYDRLFIKVLQKQNYKGPKIFFEMYRKVRPDLLFRFLDEETTLREEVSIILKLPYRPFIKALFDTKKDPLN